MATYAVARKLPGMGFNVSHADGNRAFTAKHHAGFKEERWDLTDTQGSAVATLTLERMHSDPTYVIGLPGQAPVTVSREGPYARTWTLDASSGAVRVVGDTGAYNWQILDANNLILATGTRKSASAHQQYTVDVEGDPGLALCVTLAIESERMHGRERMFGPLGPG